MEEATLFAHDLQGSHDCKPKNTNLSDTANSFQLASQEMHKAGQKTRRKGSLVPATVPVPKLTEIDEFGAIAGGGTAGGGAAGAFTADAGAGTARTGAVAGALAAVSTTLGAATLGAGAGTGADTTGACKICH